MSGIHLHDPVPSAPGVQIANGNQIPIMNSGSSKFSVGKSKLLLKNILHVFAVKKNLPSVKKLCDDNDFSITFDSSCVSVKDQKINENLIIGGVASGLYQLELGDETLPSINLGIKVPISSWHARLGHYNERIMKDLVHEFSLLVSSTYMLKCQSCIIGKTHQNSYPPSINTDDNSLPLDLILADVWGPAPMVSANGCRYYVLFVDKATHFN